MFFQEQFNLIFKTKVSYCVSSLLWFATLLFTFPGAYKSIRSATFLTMPHPKYLSKFTLKLGKNKSGLESGQISYLKKKINLLDDKERMCMLLLDEIYVKPESTYTGGELEGLALNNDKVLEPATTIQAFMISSVLSKYKDVVGLFPIKNLNTESLYKLTYDVLHCLTDIGFKELCLISDNNRVNRNMFERFCGGSLKSKFVNPFDSYQIVYVLFDPVHLFKCIRNNWLNQTDSRQSFFFPHFENPGEKQVACVSDLKTLYLNEECNYVKLAPALSKKVLFPTSIERQNVQLCCKLFDEKNIAALNEKCSLSNSPSNRSTAHFLNIILKWWKVTNVKNVYKSIRFNDTSFKAISSIDDENYKFLKNFSSWLIAWVEINVQGEEKTKSKRRGKLTLETQTALLHTVNTFIEMIEFLLQEQKQKFVLLGNFQTDSLEERFGQYRQLSGACYQISVKQVLESERKLKTISLIKLSSLKGKEICISDLFISTKETDELSEDLNENVIFDDLEVSLSNVELSDNDTLGLVYIGGYVARSALKNNSCDACKEHLTYNNGESKVIPQINNYYFNNINGGSLKYPSDYIMYVLTVAVKVFKVIISARYESEFVSSNNNRLVLINTIKGFLDVKEEQICKNCGTDQKKAY